MRTTLLPQVYERYWHPALDVACGTGRFTRAFEEAVGPGGLTIGLDGARTMLAKAAAEGGPGTVAYLRADAVRIPLRASTVDAVCSWRADRRELSGVAVSIAP
ncbi:methyltransferase domain-containing protein [Amycolatopsis sp., V23-08]|uniref:Methyltransferase domain-containing protein n=1 Tax=Amycolatopsis heterodermiae TaxID=3110235 RepID=A0ABU5RGN2_9PSEU|nr:methyltransferase domain-containing protein [Amycolatopsis sp., V23-08]MEA5365432.1 methyltransferase domain-containing protein [Amycolatopsis sp., V23-08]